MAIAGIGIALAILLVGVCWIAVQDSGPNVTEVFTHRCALQVPIRCRPALYVHNATFDTSILDGLWIALATLAGALIGTLIPFSLPILRRDLRYSEDEPRAWKRDKLDPPSIAAVALAAISSVVIIVWASPLLLFAIGGLLLGLLIPSPAWRD